MKLNNIAGCKSINDYVKSKTEKFSNSKKEFAELFEFMFSEKSNVIAEVSNGYKIKKITYGESYLSVFNIAKNVNSMLSGSAEKGSMVGLYMSNSIVWIETFWALLMCGYKPLLLNMRLSDEIIDDVIRENGVSAVISDGKDFSVKTIKSFDIIEKNSDDGSFVPSWENEIIFMSSGTTNKVKLCIYSGENFYYQVKSSYDIINNCPKIRTHYEGELKQLALLPFYHVFGFIAVYIWFGFYSRTFVFLKDMNPQTIQNTVKRHKVTHIFAVPLVWESVYKAVMLKIKARGEKTYAKFEKGVKLVNRLGALGDKLKKKLFKEIREGLFGDSVQFLISGGGAISKEALAFFNSIGYHIANGYGMTEIGITSVEMSNKDKVLNSASIGNPFLGVEYKIDDSGELLVRAQSRASKIIENGVVTLSDYSEWFKTKDLMRNESGRYYIDGRSDDLIICDNGENLNPNLIEPKLKIKNVSSLCLFNCKNKGPTLILSAPTCYSKDLVKEILNEVKLALTSEKLEGVIKDVVITPLPLMEENDFKISRTKIAGKFERGDFPILKLDDDSAIDERCSTLEGELKELVADSIGIDVSKVQINSDLFLDLGYTSLHYFTLMEKVKSKYGFDLPIKDGKALSTVCEIYNQLKNFKN